MNMKDIINQRIKIGKTSITVKDDNNKTRGIVRNISRFADLQPNKAFELFQTVKAAGLWGCGDDTIQRVIYADGQLYYLHNLRDDDSYNRYFADNPEEWPQETAKFLHRQALMEQAAKYVAVIPCYI